MTVIITVISLDHLFADRMRKYMDKNIYFLPIPDSPFILMKYNTGSCHKPGHFSTEWAEISDLQTTIALGKWGNFLYD